MAFEGQVLQLSEANLEELFKSSPAGSPSADNLVVGKENTVEIEAGEDPSQPTGTNFAGGFNIPMLEDELADEEKSTEDEPAETEKDGKSTPPVKTKAKPEEGTADPANPKEKAKTGKEGEADDPDETKSLNPEDLKQMLSSTVDYLIQSGKWVDFEGREDLELTDEVYADLVVKQDEYRVSKMFNELVDSTGDYGKAIISHIKNGGNPDEIIDIFKEQKQLQQIDTSTEVGKQSMIEKYYKEVLGWKPEKVERTVKRLITDNEIDTEFTDVKEMYDKHYQEQLQQTQEKAKQQELENTQRQATFVNNIKSALQQDTSLTENDKSLIQNSVFNFKHTLPNGQKVNDFYVKFAELQADPKEYIEFVRYVMDKENYKKSLRREEKTVANKNAFSFIKGGTALSKTKNSQTQINESKEKPYKGTDFSFALKK
jgi:hypothetical protein